MTPSTPNRPDDPNRPRVLFTAVPAHGHVVPLIPLARAAQRAASAVRFATADTFRSMLAPIGCATAGPPFAQLEQTFMSRWTRGPVTGVDVDAFTEMFATVRFELTYADLLDVAQRERAQLLVVDREDMVGPVVAAALGLPWVRVLLGPDLPEGVRDAMWQRAALNASNEGVEITDPPAEIDPWPPFLRPADQPTVTGRITMRPEALSLPGTAGLASRGAAGRPSVLMTLGTVARDPEPVSAALESLAALDVDVVLTGREGQAWPIELGSRQVTQVGYAPLADLLAGTDVAVVAGGAGTVSGCLSAGVPLVVMPQVFDQFAIAGLLRERQLGIVVERPADVGGAVARALRDPTVRLRAAGAQAQIERMPSTDETWAQILSRLR